MDGYEVKIVYSPNDECYVAEVVEIVGCAADGHTPEEALANLRSVKAAWIDSMKRRGHPIPSPQYRAHTRLEPATLV